MAKKTIAKSRSKTGAKAAMAKHSKDDKPASKKVGFGTRKGGAGGTRVASVAAKSADAKVTKKPARKSTIGKVVGSAAGAVASTMSSVADRATSLFKRGGAQKSR